MISTIAIVTPHIDDFDWCVRQLRPHGGNPRFLSIRRTDNLDHLTPGVLDGARIIAFCTDVVIPAPILEQTRYGAYNFHPGPPTYPGWFPSCFAVYDGATEFGATAHIMAERVDSGPIVGTNLFAMTPDQVLIEVDQRACLCAGQLLSHMARDLMQFEPPLPPLGPQWSGRRSTKKMFAALCEVTDDMPSEERARRARAVGAERIERVAALSPMARALMEGRI